VDGALLDLISLVNPCRAFGSTDSLAFTKEAGVHIGFLHSLPVWGAALVLLGTLVTLAAVCVLLAMSPGEMGSVRYPKQLQKAAKVEPLALQMYNALCARWNSCLHVRFAFH
jgi:hypothetical protein